MITLWLQLEYKDCISSFLSNFQFKAFEVFGTLLNFFSPILHLRLPLTHDFNYSQSIAKTVVISLGVGGGEADSQPHN